MAFLFVLNIDVKMFMVVFREYVGSSLLWFEALACLYKNFVEKNCFGYDLGSPMKRRHHAYGSFKDIGIDFLGFGFFTCFFRSVMKVSYNIVIIQYRLKGRGVFGLG